jgi:peroxiredoxin Q/BCP
MTDRTYPNLADFAAPLLDDAGEPVRLDSFLGRRTLIFFFPKANTSGCTEQACGFRDAFPQIEEKGAVVVGISPDAPKDLKKWRDKEKLPYVLLSDADHRVAEAYGVWGEKKMYGRTYMGVIRSHFIIGPDGAVQIAAVKVSPKQSVESGVAALLE